MKPQPPADKRTLIRRVTLELTGLPPTRQEIQQFEQDDAPDAYRKLVDSLLSTPQYGEHMARYWLDLVRFADTNGMHHDHYHELSQYRDWVIRAFNANMPFDQFATYQLAATNSLRSLTTSTAIPKRRGASSNLQSCSCRRQNRRSA